MLLTDYLYGEPDLKWQYAKQGGVCFAAVRAPEKEFELANAEHWRTLCERYQAQGFNLWFWSRCQMLCMTILRWATRSETHVSKLF